MNTTDVKVPQVPVRPAPAAPGGLRFGKGHLAVLLILCLLLSCAAGVAGYFRLSSESRVLRSSLMESVGGEWDKKFAVHVGSLTMGVVRLGSHFIHLPPEPRAALDTLHGAEVGIYHLREEPHSINATAIFDGADRAMKARGWDRIVGVTHERELVAVYFPRKVVLPSKMSCCLMIFHNRELVIVSARGNLEPLLEIARKRMDHIKDEMQGRLNNRIITGQNHS